MTIRLSDVVDLSLVGIMAIMLFVAMVLIGGCTVKLYDKGEVAVEFTQGVKISHSTSATQAKTAAILDFVPLADFLLDWDKIGATTPAAEIGSNG